MAEATKTVGRFQIVERIGRGGMAVVYLARQPGLDRVVALKELRRFDDEADGTLAERFLREARMAGSLSHPNVVTVFDYFEEHGTPYIAMEYMERGSLRPLIGTLGLAQVAGVLQGVLSGLAHAEAKGIVHRDLKPENLLVGSDGGIKIADLGIAKAFNQVSMGLTKSGMAIGTPTYMAPEQATAKGVGPWTDLYATGVIAYELLVGRVPFFEIDTPLSILWQHVHDPIPPPHELNPALDPRLGEWLERMLAKASEERPRSAREAWHDLEEIVVELLGWRWRQSASLVEPVEEQRLEAEAVSAEPAPRATDGFETFQPSPVELRTPAEAEPATPTESTPETPLPESPVEDVAPFGEPEPSELEVEPEPVAEAVAEAEPSAAEARTLPPARIWPSDQWPTGIEPPPRRRPSRRLGLAAGALALAVGAAAVVGIALRGEDGRPVPPPPPPLPDPKPLAAERIGLWVSGSTVYVAAPRGRIAALDGATLKRLAAVTDAARPRAVGVRGTSIWVANDGTLTRFSSTLRPLAATAFLRGARLAGAPGEPLVVSGRARGGRGRVCLLGRSAVGACVDLGFVPSGLGTAPGRVFAAHEDGDAVVPLRLRSGKLVAETPIVLRAGSRPHGRLAVFGGGLYVPVERGIAVLDLAGSDPPRVIRLATTPADLWIVPFNGRLFAPLYAQDRVAVLDVTAPRPQPSLVRAGRKPVAVVGGSASSPGTNAVYVASAADGTITRLNAITGRRLSSAKVRALVGRSLAPVVVRRVRFARAGRIVTARIELTGGRLEPHGVRIRDQGIADGVARLELWQGGIGTRIGRDDGYRARILIGRAPGLVSIRLTAPAGAFERLTPRLAPDGRTLLLVLTVPLPPVQQDGDDGDDTPPDRPPPPPPGCKPPPPGPNYLCINDRWEEIRFG